MEEVGLPARRAQLRHRRRAAIVGDAIVRAPADALHRRSRGRRRSASRINELAAKASPGQHLDQARRRSRWAARTRSSSTTTPTSTRRRRASWQSAFGFQGQKCSACSRAIVARRRLRRSSSRSVARRARPHERSATRATRRNYMGPGDRASGAFEDDPRRTSRSGKQEGQRRSPAAARVPARTATSSQPTVFGDVKPDARLAQEEIFGPVLAVIRGAGLRRRARDRQRHRVRPDGRGLLEEREPPRDERASASSTSATSTSTASAPARWSARHPFGGFNMSGTDCKAGGRDYLGLFLQQKSISTRTT